MLMVVQKTLKTELGKVQKIISDKRMSRKAKVKIYHTIL